MFELAKPEQKRALPDSKVTSPQLFSRQVQAKEGILPIPRDLLSLQKTLAVHNQSPAKSPPVLPVIRTMARNTEQSEPKLPEIEDDHIKIVHKAEVKRAAYSSQPEMQQGSKPATKKQNTTIQSPQARQPNGFSTVGIQNKIKAVENTSSQMLNFQNDFSHLIPLRYNKANTFSVVDQNFASQVASHMSPSLPGKDKGKSTFWPMEENTESLRLCSV